MSWVHLHKVVSSHDVHAFHYSVRVDRSKVDDV